MKYLKIAALFLGIAAAPAFAEEFCYVGFTEFGDVTLSDATNTVTDCEVYSNYYGSPSIPSTISMYPVNGILYIPWQIYFSFPSSQPFSVFLTNVLTNRALTFVGTMVQGSQIIIANSTLYAENTGGILDPFDSTLNFAQLTSIASWANISVITNSLTLSFDCDPTLGPDGEPLCSQYIAAQGVIGFGTPIMSPNSLIQVRGNAINITGSNVQAPNMCGFIFGLAPIATFNPAAPITGGTISFTENRVFRSDSLIATTNITAFQARLPLGTSGTARTSVIVADNNFDGMATVAYITVSGNQGIDIYEEDNSASYAGKIQNFVYVARSDYTTNVNVKRNKFGSYVDLNGRGGGNPTLWFGFNLLRSGSEVHINDNYIHADTFETVPLRFPWTTDLLASVIFEVFGNYLSRSSASAPSLSMASFEAAEGTDPRSSSYSTMYFCYNSWPPTFAAATTTITTTAPSTTTTTTMTTTTTTTTPTTTTTTAPTTSTTPTTTRTTTPTTTRTTFTTTTRPTTTRVTTTRTTTPTTTKITTPTTTTTTVTTTTPTSTTTTSTTSTTTAISEVVGFINRPTGYAVSNTECAAYAPLTTMNDTLVRPSGAASVAVACAIAILATVALSMTF
eukprot:GILJ01014327.1.p1 GENE.GILJ01014327.1~~GILJ01014327.1.p1  ORF type:complete len:621 (+),score=100.63 GILJ01014327.1:59-1921(+)